MLIAYYKIYQISKSHAPVLVATRRTEALAEEYVAQHTNCFYEPVPVNETVEAV